MQTINASVICRTLFFFFNDFCISLVFSSFLASHAFFANVGQGILATIESHEKKPLLLLYNDHTQDELNLYWEKL